MKITLLADIHGNLPALDAVMHHANERLAAQTILNLGDLTGYGPFPDQVVKWSISEHTINILGNYDKKVTSKSYRKTGWEKVKNADKRAMFAWTYRALSKRSRKYLGILPETRMVEMGRIKILMTHGSPDSINEHLGQDTPFERLEALADKTDANIVLCGHSHQAFLREVHNVTFINPGSVGRLDDGDPRASFAILDIDDRELNVQFYRVPYDITNAVRAMRLTGLPEIFAQVLRQGLNYDDTRAQMDKKRNKSELEPNGTLVLLTGFQAQDDSIDEMKPVIYSIAPQTNMIEIPYQTPLQNIDQAARMLADAAPRFPTGTVFAAFIDPMKNINQSSIAARIGDHFYVAPDNGLLTPLLQENKKAGQPIEIIVLNQPKYWLPNPDMSFQWRDILAPVSAHLVNGMPLDRLGNNIDNPITL